MKLKVLELFGGIGAPRKALMNIGIPFETVDFVEIDKYAVQSYNAIYNENYKVQDIMNWDKDLEVDLIFHGSPCQDFSLAGKQAGGDEGSGTRSSLLYETIRIVEKLKPKYVIWENVKNVISKKHRHNFDNYLQEMESLGYANYWQVLNAKDYGIPQNRERVFVVSILGNENYEFPVGDKCNNKINMVEIPQKAKTRKYEINTEKLKDVLRSHKNISNKKIAKFLSKPLTLVEHWFRKDDCFSVPDADVWFELKKLLNIEINEFDEAITTFEENDNMYEKSNRFYYDTGLAPTITSASANEKIIQTFTFPPKQELKLKLKDMLEDEVDEKYYLKEVQPFIYKKYNEYGDVPKMFNPYNKSEVIDIAPTQSTQCGSTTSSATVLIKEATKQGYKEAYEGDGINISSRMKYQRGNVQKGSIQTITTSGGSDRGVVLNDLRIRKLTPKECWRLMGFDDVDFEKASKINSNSQLYKQAGNSICVNVLEAILTNLLK